MKRNVNALDLVLAGTILISGGFIAYRVFQPKPLTEAGHPTPNQTDQDYMPGRTIPTGGDRRTLYGVAANQSLLYTRVLTPSQWTELKASPPVNSHLVTQTAGCDNPLGRSLSSYPIMSTKVADRLREGTLGFIFDPSNQNCIRKNSHLTLFLMDSNARSPAFQLLGDVTVEDIISMAPDQFSTDAAPIFDRPMSQVLKVLQSTLRLHSKVFHLIRISKPQPTKHDLNLPGQGFPRYNVVTSERLKSWLKANPGSTVVDVRSEKEQSQIPIVHTSPVISIPYSVKDDKWRFSWDRKNSDINNDVFDLARAAQLARSNPARPALVIGAAPFDGRPVWALLELFKLDLNNIAWFYDGASAFNEVVQQRDETATPKGGQPSRQ